MTEPRMTLIEAVQQVGDQDLLHQLAKVALVKLMDFEVEVRVGAAKTKLLTILLNWNVIHVFSQ